MISLNDEAIRYMERLGFKDIVLLTGDGRTWCDPSRMEVAVSFTDEELSPDEYMIEKSPVGLVYIPLHSVELDEEAGIRYEKYPWIEKFEIDGIRPLQTCCIWQPGISSEDTEREV